MTDISKNWYIKYAISQELLKEAGWKENIATGLMSAILMILGGSSVEAASKETKVPVETISRAMQNKNLIQKVKETKQPMQNTQKIKTDVGTKAVEVKPVNSDIDWKPDIEISKPARSSEVSKKEDMKSKTSDSVSVNDPLIHNVALTLWGEARGEDEKGIAAVATVIYNRAHGQSDKLLKVIKAPKQFEVWNNGNKPSIKIQNNNDKAIWNYCQKVATEMVNNTFKPMDSWTHYYNPSNAKPSWGANRSGVMIGQHKFMTI